MEGSIPKKSINFLRGWPAPALLPSELLRNAAETVLTSPEIFVPALQYGPDPGYEPLREQLAKFLGDFYQTKSNPERICITGGASQNIACVLQSFTDPAYTQYVWAVTPCYYLACPIFEDAGFKGRLRAVPEDEEGIDLEFLARGLESCSSAEHQAAAPKYKDPGPLRKMYRHIIYVVPTSANPSGKTMSLRRREGLVQMARRHNALVICDDVYDFLQWPVLSPSARTSQGPHVSKLPQSSILPRLSDIDFALGPSSFDEATPGSRHFGHAISNGSFSKILGPGVRTGWAEATPAFAFGLAQTGSTKSGGAPSQLSAALICEIMRTDELGRHIDNVVVPALQRRHGLLMDAIEEYLVPAAGGSDKVVMRQSSLEDHGDGPKIFGGYFVWLTFPDGPLAADIAARALQDENLIISAGTNFEVMGDAKAFPLFKCIRLCFAWLDEVDIVNGVRALARVVEALRGENLNGNVDVISEGGAIDQSQFN